MRELAAELAPEDEADEAPAEECSSSASEDEAAEEDADEELEAEEELASPNIAGTGAMLGLRPRAATTSIVFTAGEPNSILGTSRWPKARPVVTRLTLVANSVTALLSLVGEESRRGLPSLSMLSRSDENRFDDFRLRVEKKLPVLPCLLSDPPG